MVETNTSFLMIVCLNFLEPFVPDYDQKLRRHKVCPKCLGEKVITEQVKCCTTGYVDVLADQIKASL